MDPSDRDELRDRIAAMPPERVDYLTKLTMHGSAIEWLKRRDENDQVGKLQCRYQTGGQWTNWADQEPPCTVIDIVNHLIEAGDNITYVMAKELWEAIATQARKTDLMNSLPIPGGATVECRFVGDFRYDPEKVPAELTDPNAVDFDDIMQALIQLPAPPPGWAIPELVPLLCPLGAGPGWGCPPTPTDPTGGQPTDPTGGQPGDRP